MATCMKRQRVDTQTDQYFSVTSIRRLAEALQTIVTFGQPHLTPLKIINCNAADSYRGMPFSKAYCCTEESNDRLFFGEIFQRGIDILIEFVDKRELPANKQENYILRKLLRYVEKDEQFLAEDLESVSESQLAVLLTNHLFGQLATSTHFTVDKNCESKQKNSDCPQCPCGRLDCKLTGSFGDTSIGNGHVWHGNSDIIVNGNLVVKYVESKTSGQGEVTPVEVKACSDLSRNSQTISTTIVFSFLQKRQHPENDHFLIPGIGVGRSEIVILFYDAQHDVLLESSRIPFLESSGVEDAPKKLSLTLVLVSWLVVNYSYLCTGLTEDMSAYTADFFECAKEKLEVYKEKLLLGNIHTFVQKKKGDVNFRRGIFTRDRSKRMSDILYHLYETDENNPNTS